MRGFLFITFLLCSIIIKAQVIFKTVVPGQPVVAGESFQVQYILEDAENAINLKPPVFKNFRYIAGPNVYTGTVSGKTGLKSLRNFVYTVEASKPGKYVIPGTTILVDGQLIKSNDALINVITKEEAAVVFRREVSTINPDYVLRPSEDPFIKIRQNLFLKVTVDKRSCFTGEPVTAVFKLYSRLQSKSDIVKNPGFYGFSVFDMVNLADKQVSTELMNGKAYDVHIIRKVQLYPLQPGEFVIDPMEVKNKVEFSRAVVNKKTEQEIAEGMFGGSDDEPVNKDAEVFETSMATEPVSISVKPTPANNKPENYTGATGNFSITAVSGKTELAKNEDAWLEIVIQGKGNFMQLTAPAVSWPAGMESFEPTTNDDFDKTKIPVTGKRIFRYPFVCLSEGQFEIPAIAFSWFDVDSNKYKKAFSLPLKIMVKGEVKKDQVKEENKKSVADINNKASRFAAAIVIGLVLVVVGFWFFKKKESAATAMMPVQDIRPSVDEMLKPAVDLLASEGNSFYSVLYQLIWKYLGNYFKLSGSEVTKQQLLLLMTMHKPAAGDSLETLLNECETRMFTNITEDGNREKLMEYARELLEALD
jgi:hypothetical protein